MSGFLYVFFLVIFGIALPLALHYWQKRKKKLAIRWSLIAAVAAVIGLICAAVYYIPVSAPTRPYVVFRVLRLSAPLAAGHYPVLECELENLSTTNEVTVELRDITYYFTPTAVQTLAYQTAPPTRFVMAPTQHYIAHVRFEKFIISDDQLKAFNEKQSFLYFFGLGKYSAKFDGRSYPLSFCGMYDPDLQGNLSLCTDNVKFK